MSYLTTENKARIPRQNRQVFRTSVFGRLKRDKWMYLLLTPGILYFVIFKYVPM